MKLNGPIESDGGKGVVLEKRLSSLIASVCTRGRQPCSCASRADMIVARSGLRSEGENINGKSIMGVMMLAAGQGSKLLIRCEGPDADKAM